MFLMPSMGIGGAETVLINLLNIIDYNKYDVTLFLGRETGELLGKIPLEVDINGIFPNYLIDRICTVPYRKFGLDLGLKIYGKKIVGKYDVAVSFCDTLYSDLFFFSNAQIKKKVVVIQSSYITYKGFIQHNSNKKLARLKNRYRKFDTVVAVSHEAMDEFNQLLGSYADMKVIYNPLNIKHILQSANENINVYKNSDVINLIAVGRLNKVKGYDRLIKAFALLNERKIKFSLSIIGVGPQKDELQGLINELKLEDKVILQGFIENVYPWIKQADIYVMTSLSEGLPTALCEAIVLHKPVLTTNVSGCREVINKGEYGVLVEGKPEDIANGLKKLIQNEELRCFYSDKSKQRAKIFDDQVVLNQYYNLFNSDI